ncbi:hypothetical protein K493DRAFT_336996, partial [Basidiobolus meristosporus CBS 931.73]
MSELKPHNEPANSATKDVASIAKHENPYVELILRRLRTLKKRWSKIERYAEVIGTSSEGKVELNSDQIQAWEKRDEVSSAIRELEDMVKQFTTVDSEETKAHIARAKEQERQSRRAARRMAEEAENSAAGVVFHCVGLFHGWCTREEVPEPDARVLSAFKEIVVAQFSTDDKAGAQKDVYESLKKLANGSEEEIPGIHGVCYQDVASALTRSIGPPRDADPTPVEEVEESHAIEFASDNQELVHYDGDDTVVIHEVIVPPGGIRFMSTSEILEEPLEQDDTHDSSVNGTAVSLTSEEPQEGNDTLQDIADQPDTESTRKRNPSKEHKHRGGHRGGYRGKRNGNGTTPPGQSTSDENRRGGNRGRGRGRGGRGPGQGQGQGQDGSNTNGEHPTRGKGQSRGNRGHRRGRGR